MEAGSFARLEGRNFEFYMTKRRVVIGRNSKLGEVDVNMGSSRFISRKHLEIVLDRNIFYALCRGKNGIFVDDTFQRRENKRVSLPNSCIIRFPSTQIKIAFTSLLEDLGPPPPMHSPALPARVDTQYTSPSPFVSPMPSPTGTISAVNSCPVSPNSDFRSRVPSFDFKVMATYASRLLSSQHRQHHSDSEGQGEEHGVGHVDDTESDKHEMGGVSSDVMAMSTDITAEEDKMDETLPQDDDGEVPGDSATDKAEESSQDEVDKLPSEKPHQKPPFSYAQLIVQALLASGDRKQTLSNIYNFISEKYPFYKLEDKGWKNSIRHNLSLNQYFMKAPREREGLGFGKGGYWCMHPDYEDKLTAQAYVKRKKKGIPVFPSAGLLSSRSAPPSPTHHTFRPDINLKEIETKLPLATPPTTSHFALPPFFTQFTGTANSSHSLPSSPSRPRGFSATPLKFFPMGIPRSSSTDDLIAAQQKVHKPLPDRRVHEVITIDDNTPPPPKRVRIMDDQRSPLDGGRGDLIHDSHPARHMQLPTLGSRPMVGGASAGVQFLPIPLMPTSGIPGPPSQTLLTQPLSSFLPQSFFAVAGHAQPNQPHPEGGAKITTHVSGGSNNEG